MQVNSRSTFSNRRSDTSLMVVQTVGLHFGGAVGVCLQSRSLLGKWPLLQVTGAPEDRAVDDLLTSALA